MDHVADLAVQLQELQQSKQELDVRIKKLEQQLYDHPTLLRPIKAQPKAWTKNKKKIMIQNFPVSVAFF